MSALTIHLFGKFNAHANRQSPAGLDACKAHELLSYFHIKSERPHTRECPNSKSRKASSKRRSEN